LRTELGDVDYSRYLAANGRQTDIQVYGVLDSSPAQTAGLRPGDRIQRYGGQRIFTVRELTEQTLQGNPGENVAVDILRDGMPMQVVLPRGPLGVTGGPR
jgi:S1-C subfamily serine protease